MLTPFSKIKQYTKDVGHHVNSYKGWCERWQVLWCRRRVKPVWPSFLNFSIFVLTSLFPHRFLEAFAKFKKQLLLRHVYLSIRRSVRLSLCLFYRTEQLGFNWKNSHKLSKFEDISKICEEYSSFNNIWQYQGRLNLHEDICTVMVLKQFFANVKYRHMSQTASQLSLCRHSVIRIIFHYAKEGTEMIKPSYLNHTDGQFPCL